MAQLRHNPFALSDRRVCRRDWVAICKVRGLFRGSLARQKQAPHQSAGPVLSVKRSPVPGLGQAASVSLALWSLEPAGGPDFAAGYLPNLDGAEHVAVFVELDVPAGAVVVDVLAIGDQR